MKECEGDYWDVSYWECRICDEQNCQFRKGLTMKEAKHFRLFANFFIITTVLLALYFLLF